jgi:drug/metabolite transporter (DMT)-like permease
MGTHLHKRAILSDTLLLFTAVIWGFGFVAQRAGMDHVGPFTFSAIRFALGGLALMPLMWMLRNRKTRKKPGWKQLLLAGSTAGAALFMGVTFQQVGIVSTSAGKAGFITGMYVVLVPLLGRHVGFQTNRRTWTGAMLAVAGLYFLSIGDLAAIRIERGDLLVLTGAFFWAVHVLVIARLVNRTDPIQLACMQFLTCSLLSAAVAVVTEECSIADVQGAMVPILYGGLGSVGIAYTLQVVAQEHAPPAHAAIILSLESVFAVVGGILILSESLSTQAVAGCGLMLAGMILSQLGQEEASTDLHPA